MLSSILGCFLSGSPRTLKHPWLCALSLSSSTLIVHQGLLLHGVCSHCCSQFTLLNYFLVSLCSKFCNASHGCRHLLLPWSTQTVHSDFLMCLLSSLGIEIECVWKTMWPILSFVCCIILSPTHIWK